MKYKLKLVDIDSSVVAAREKRVGQVEEAYSDFIDGLTSGSGHSAIYRT